MITYNITHSSLRQNAGKYPVTIYTTNACPDSCAHCHINAVGPDSTKRIDLDLDTIKLILDVFQPEKRHACNDNHFFSHDVVLNGGEFFIHPEFPEIIDYLKKNDYSLYIWSSGLPLIEKDTGLWDALRKLDRNDYVWISSDAFHRITGSEVNDIKEYMRQNGYEFGLGYPEKHIPQRLVPSARARKLANRFDFSACSSECIHETDFGALYIGVKGNILYCPLIPKDHLGTVTHLEGMNRDDALDFVSGRIYDKVKGLRSEYPVLNCWDHLQR